MWTRSPAEFRMEISGYFPSQSPGLVNYVVHCSPPHGFCYVETAKVGCTTIKALLQRLVGGPEIERLPPNVHDRDASPIQRLSQLPQSLQGIMEDRSILKFTFVRNPYTRVLSAYLDKMVQNDFERRRLAPKLGLDPEAPISLMDFLLAVSSEDRLYDDIHWTPQSYLTAIGHVPYDFIGRFEQFGDGLRAVFQRLAPSLLDEVEMMRRDVHRTGSRERVDELIGTEERALIRSIYSDDFRWFAYGDDPSFSAL